MKIVWNDNKIVNYTAPQIEQGKHKSFFGYITDNAVGVLKTSPGRLFFGGSCNIGIALKRRDLAKWGIELKCKARRNAVSLRGASLTQVNSKFVKNLNIALNAKGVDLSKANPANVAKLVAGLMASEKELKFVFKHYNELRQKAGGAPLNLDIIKRNLKNKDVQAQAKELVALIAKEHVDAGSVTAALKNALVGNIIFEVAFLAATLVFGQTFMGFIIAGAVADIAINMGMGFVNGVCEALNKKSLVSLVKDPVVGLWSEYQKRANDPDTLHPLWDTFGFPICFVRLLMRR